MLIKFKEKVCDVRFKETLQNKGLGTEQRDNPFGAIVLRFQAFVNPLMFPVI